MNGDVTRVPDDLEVPAAELEEALERSGWSASKLARALQVEVGTVSRWRRGYTKLSRSRFVAVLAVLGMPLDWKPTPGWKSSRKQTGRPRARTRSA